MFYGFKKDKFLEMIKKCNELLAAKKKWMQQAIINEPIPLFNHISLILYLKLYNLYIY